MKISYCVTACNEHAELNRLLTFLNSNILPEDEIIVQLDSNHTPEMEDLLGDFSLICKSKFAWSRYPLDKDFATFKNNLFVLATGDYIFQLDADEMPPVAIIKHLRDLINENPGIDLIWVPRINEVDGLTPELITEWKWSLNVYGWVNWPDWQGRIYKNDSSRLRWDGRVHERIASTCDDFKHCMLPEHPELALWHYKRIEKQIEQNKLYDGI